MREVTFITPILILGILLGSGGLAARAEAVFKVEIEADVSGDLKPFVHGRTTLPTGTQLEVSLKATYPACAGRCGYSWLGATVIDGKFSAGPFDSWTSLISGQGGPDQDLDPGYYTVIVNTFMKSFLAETARRVVGEKGERMVGPAVVVGPSTSPLFVFEGERGVYYARRVVIPAKR